MNERIRELAEQADDYTDNKVQMPGEYHPDWHDIRDQMFAEMIINSCLEIVQQGWTNPDEDKIASDIKEYFGLE